VILRIALVLIVAAHSAALAAQSWNPICQHLDVGDFPLHQEQVFGSIKVSVDYKAQEPEDRARFPESRVKSYGICEFRVTTSAGIKIATGRDESVMPLQHADLDGDGVPELIVKTESGGSAGCAALYVIQSRPPYLLGAVHGCEGLQVVDPNHNGHPAIEAHDSFDLPELGCHTCEPNVPVYFRFEDGKLKDVSRDFAAEYDHAIGGMRSQMRPKHIQALLAARTESEIAFLPGFKTAQEAEMNHEPFDEMASRTHEYVIRITFCYLVSGRPEQAWRTLDEMWPLWDRRRIKNEILERLEQSRTDGILKYVSR
jgi:hypothetical protein